MTSLAVAIGGEVNITLLIDAANELLRFLLRTWIDVAQQPIQGEGATPDQICSADLVVSCRCSSESRAVFHPSSEAHLA
jgi:hypothetical protein